MFYLEIFPRLIWTRFFVKFPVKFDEIFKYAWNTLQHVCKKCPTFENVTDFRYSKQKKSKRFRNVYYIFANFKWYTGLVSCIMHTDRVGHGTGNSWWHSWVCVCVWLVYAFTECFTLLKLGAAEVWSPVVLHVIISFQIALVLQTYTRLT